MPNFNVKDFVLVLNGLSECIFFPQEINEITKFVKYDSQCLP